MRTLLLLLMCAGLAGCAIEPVGDVVRAPDGQITAFDTGIVQEWMNKPQQPSSTHITW